MSPPILLTESLNRLEVRCSGNALVVTHRKIIVIFVFFKTSDASRINIISNS